MNEPVKQRKLCPRCQKEYSTYPSLSRLDNKTLICPDCGTREALSTIGVSPEEQEKILSLIHQAYK